MVIRKATAPTSTRALRSRRAGRLAGAPASGDDSMGTSRAGGGHRTRRRAHICRAGHPGTDRVLGCHSIGGRRTAPIGEVAMRHGTGAFAGLRVSSVRLVAVTWVIAGCWGGPAPHASASPNAQAVNAAGGEPATTAAVEGAPPAAEKPEDIERRRRLAG